MKVLLRGDSPFDPKAILIEVAPPEGFRRVFRGALCPGDMYLHAALALDGVITWVPLESMPTEAEVRSGAPYTAAHWFACLIRRGHPVDLPCERCECKGRKPGHRFCCDCCLDIVRERR